MLENIDVLQTLIRITASLGLGMIIALTYMYKTEYNKQFIVMLTLLPAIVGAVISIVNGNLGTGVAVMGAFSLVRFRSIPGTAKEIGFIFFAMAIGLATGMGYIAYALMFTFVVGLFSLVLFKSKFGEKLTVRKQIKITIPENLCYTGLFDDIFDEYATYTKLVNVKTTNMGSLYKLVYDIELKDPDKEKELIDKLRCRNGNLEIACGYISSIGDVL